MDTKKLKTPIRLLAWDTSSTVGVLVALEQSAQTPARPYRVVAQWRLSLETSKHSERLLWAIDTVLQSAGWTLDEVSAFAVGVGPGSFTGLRIGLTTAKLLAFGRRLPIIPLSSLAILARAAELAVRVHPKADSTWILALQDAAKGEWFALSGLTKHLKNGLVPADGDRPGVWARGLKQELISPQAMLEQVKRTLAKNRSWKWLAVGGVVERYPELLAQLPKSRRIELESIPEALALAQMAWEGAQQGLLFEASQIRPHYLRASDAEVKLKKGLLKPAPLIHRTGIA